MEQDSIKKSKYCQVCGDEAKAFNYNGLTCQSCKMFFRRNSARLKDLKCKNLSERCTIDQTSRTYCPRCRLVKCFSIGMSQKTIGKRSRKVKDNENSNKLIGLEENQSKGDEYFKNDFENISKFIPKPYPDELTPPELVIIQEIRHATMQAFTDESKIRVSRVANSNIESFNLYANYVRKIIKFCKNVQAFKALSPGDQLTTLKGVFFDIVIVRRIYQFNPNNDQIRLLGNETGDFTIVVKYTGDSGSLPKKYEFFEKFKSSFHSLIKNDETLRDLIIGHILFKPKNRITCPEYVNYEHTVYSRLLRRYLCHKSSNVDVGEEMFYILMCLLDKLSQFKEHLLEFILAHIDRKQVDQALREVLEIE